MTASPAAKLYSTELLSLATELAAYPFDNAMPYKAEVRSRTCGSTLGISLACDEECRINSIGLSVSACAVGQASAAVFAGGAAGASLEQIAQALDAIENWLAHSGARSPAWPRFDALAPGREHKGRHGAIVMPWKAAIEALSKAEIKR